MKPRFTLWELCVLVSAVLSLAILLVPAMLGGTCRGYWMTTCKNNQRQIATGLLQFKDDHDYRFPSEADFKGGNPFWVGGGIADRPGTLDPARPLAKYVRDWEMFECPLDSGTSAFDNPQHCYTAWGTSYLWAAKDIPEVGITGMLGRKYTDPLLGASSLKIMTFEPTLCATQRPLPKQDQWHGSGPGWVIIFMDGHADLVKNPAPPRSGPMDEKGLARLSEEKRPYY